MPGIGTFVLRNSPIKQATIQVMKTAPNVNPTKHSLNTIVNPNTALHQKSKMINITNQSVRGTLGTIYDIIV